MLPDIGPQRCCILVSYNIILSILLALPGVHGTSLMRNSSPPQDRHVTSQGHLAHKKTPPPRTLP